MAFVLKRLSCVGPAGNSNSPRIWTYKTDDAHATVDGAGYMNAAVTLLAIGDLIDVVVVTNLDASNEALSTYGRHAVINKDLAAGTIDLTNVTVGTVTDSD